MAFAVVCSRHSECESLMVWVEAECSVIFEVPKMHFCLRVRYFPTSTAATSSAKLKLHWLKALKPTHEIVQSYLVLISFQLSQYFKFCLQATSDASSKNAEGISNVCGGFLTFEKKRELSESNKLDCSHGQKSCEEHKHGWGPGRSWCRRPTNILWGPFGGDSLWSDPGIDGGF